ncbi:MAG: hypothetical protein AAFN77_07160 [Planctomycetota bacterium]
MLRLLPFTDRCRPLADSISRLVFVLLATIVLSPSSLMAQAHDDTPMQLSGFSPSEAFEIKDDLELDSGAPIVNQLLYRVMKTSPKSRAEYYQMSQNVTWQQLLDETASYRFWMIQRRMRVQRIEKYSVRGASDDAEIQRYFICYGTAEMEASSDDPTNNSAASEVNCRVIVRNIPDQLATNDSLNESVMFEGFLYCRTVDDAATDGEVNQPALVFVADRLGWFPDATERASDAQVTLGNLNFDVGLFDGIRKNHGKGLLKSDNEAFFQLLAAVKGATGDAAINRQPGSRSTLTDLLRDSSKKLGSVVQLTAVCRTCTRMEIPYEDIRNRIGVTEYYQLVLFPKLSQKVIMSEDGKDVELDRYAVTVCCTELPEGMTPEQMERQQVSIDGIFFRIWKFETEATDRAGISGTMSPLIIANQPQVLKSNTADLNRYVLIFVLSVIAAIGLLLLYLRITDRRDKTHAETLLESLPEKIDVSGLKNVD